MLRKVVRVEIILTCIFQQHAERAPRSAACASKDLLIRTAWLPVTKRTLLLPVFFLSNLSCCVILVAVEALISRSPH